MWPSQSITSSPVVIASSSALASSPVNSRRSIADTTRRRPAARRRGGRRPPRRRGWPTSGPGSASIIARIVDILGGAMARTRDPWHWVGTWTAASPPGDFAADEVMPVGRLTDDWYFVCGVDVVAPPAAGAIVALGDSLTDANISTHDGHHSWPAQLARRLVARPSGRPMAVMNQGLGGNRILHDIRGDSGLRRFDRDVLAQPGVTHTVIMLGTNDLRNRNGKPEEEVTAPQMIAGLKQFAVRGQARGIKVIGGTLTPFENETFLPGAWNPRREAVRQAVNEWLRKAEGFDAIIDFDRALRDPAHPTQMLPIYDCGDHLHPSDLGYRTMGDAIDLGLFE